MTGKSHRRGTRCFINTDFTMLGYVCFHMCVCVCVCVCKCSVVALFESLGGLIVLGELLIPCYSIVGMNWL